MNKEMYSVERGYYSDFIHHLKNGTIKVVTYSVGSEEHNEVWSKERNVKLCERISYPDSPEEYYVFEYDLPDSEFQEWVPPITVELTTKEQVQKFVDYLAEKRKEATKNE